MDFIYSYWLAICKFALIKNIACKKTGLILFYLILTCSIGFAQAQTKGVKPQVAPIKKDTGTFRAVIVGISDYQNDKIPDLHYAHKDAEAFVDYLLNASGIAIDSNNILLLLNEQATSGSVVGALYWLMDNSKEGDVAIVYFSGHGDVESTTMNQPGFLLCWDSPARVYMGGGTFPLQYLQEIVMTLSTTNKSKVIVITDACHAGKLAGSQMGGPQATTTNLAKQYANENKIMSCQANEFSLEGKSWGGGRGVFSYYFVNGIKGLADRNKDGYISVLEIERYLGDEVPNAVAPHSQIPVTIGNKSNLIAKVDPKILAELKLSLNNPTFEPSSDKGMLDAISLFEDTTLQQTYLNFQMALKDFRLLYPETNSAWYYFQIIKNNKEIFPYLGLMQRNLAAALQDNAQQAINDYLKSDPVELRNRWTYEIKYDRYPEYLNKAAELLGESHFYYKTLKARQYYFEGLNLRLNGERKQSKEFFLKAITEQEKCLNLEPLAPFARNELGILNRRLGKYQESINQFNQAVKLSPTWSLPWANLCGSYFELDDLKKAEECGIKAVQLDSLFALSYYNLGLVYQKQQSYSNAIANFKSCIQVDPEYKTAYFKLAYLNLEEGNYSEAYKMGLQYYRIDSTDIYNLINLGEITSNLNNVDEAASYYIKALKLKPNSELVLEEISKFYLNKQNYNQAEMHLLKLVFLRPTDANSYYLLSKSKAMQNNKGECLRYISMALENGYRDLDSILNDPAFTKMAKKRSFKKILNRYFILDK